MAKEIALIGYSGHSYVVFDILKKRGKPPKYYCEVEEKDHNPFELEYLGYEKNPEVVRRLEKLDYVLGVGDNEKRESIYTFLSNDLDTPVTVIHPKSTISEYVNIGGGVLVCASVAINPLATIGDGVICNTGCIIEHESTIGDFTHIAPSATILGNVNVGRRCLIGGGSVIKPEVTIGDYATVGAGAVVIEDVPQGAVVVGNPHRRIDS